MKLKDDSKSSDKNNKITEFRDLIVFNEFKRMTKEYYEWKEVKNSV